MYIVYLTGSIGDSTIFEEKQEAFEYALNLSKTDGVQVSVYKANLIATVEIPTEPILIKIKKQRIAKPEVFEAAVEKVVKSSVAKAAKKLKALTEPPLSNILKDIAEDPQGTEPVDEELPMGARCALDNNLAVGKRKGPTGEYVYLCVDCMGQLQ